MADMADLRLPGFLLGVGLGGFVDGIVLHQLLQWHHMLSSSGEDNIGLQRYGVDTVAGLEVNTFFDGLFHAFTWVAVLAGVVLLASRLRHPAQRSHVLRVLTGWLAVGWGVFNLVEGVLAHHLLGLHHVRSGEFELWYDLGYLTLGAVLVVGGWLLQRSAGRPGVG